MRNGLLCGFLFIAFSAFGQTEMVLSARDSQLIISGTSSLHPWQCKAEQLSGQLKGELQSGTIKVIHSLVIHSATSFIRSIKENGEYYDKNMDKNIYKALDAGKHPNITFTFIRLISSKPSGVEIAGILRIAGTSKEIVLTARATPISNGIVFEGKTPIKMTDYNVEPPTALFGTIKTGNEVIVEYKATFFAVK